jgi:hypothetical protein
MISTPSNITSKQNDKHSHNLVLLDSFCALPDNWNGNSATKFDSKFVEHVKSIVIKLEVSPKTFPTGRGSIQLEYEKKNGDYIEFEIFPNNTINFFSIVDQTETEARINENQINQYLLRFYAAS